AVRVLFDLLSDGFLHLCDGLRGGRIDGDDDPGRRTVGDADSSDVGDRAFRFIQHHSQPEFTARLLGFDVSVLCAYYNAGANRYGNAAAVADRFVFGNWRRHDCRIDLAGVADLSRRDVDDRQEGHDSGSVALGETGLESL